MKTKLPHVLTLSLVAILLYAAGAIPGMAQDRTFTVTVAEKTPEHPYYEQGWPEGYVVDGTQGQVLTLVRGQTYTFQMQDVPAIHPFYISTSESGAGEGVYGEGVTNNFATGDETLTFTPGADTPDQLYYQCGTHEFMGSRIEVVTQAEVGLESVAGGFTHPVMLEESPDDTGRLFIVDQTGQIYVRQSDGTMEDEPFLDVSDRIVDLNENYDERGLLGLAFHPDYASNGRFFIYYSAPLRPEAPTDFNHTSHISEFRVSDDDPNRADPGSETILLQVDQPQSNHNAGTLAFGPSDGYLYIALGDGGGRDDEGTGHVSDWYDFNAGGNGQDVTQNLLGSILRIDVDDVPTGSTYGIPADNPFVGTDAPAEQFAYGFRNPYRFSFDRGGENALLVGDAGQDMFEEVSVVTLGGNYGWNVKEGRHCFDAANPESPPAECPETDPEGDPLVDPVIEFLNANQEGGLGLVVVGGHVYRGSAMPSLEGRYIFGAWSRGEEESGGEEVHFPGRIFVAEPRAEGPWPFHEVSISGSGSMDHFVLSFAQDRSGEVYVLTTDEVGPTGTTGQVFRLVPAEAVARERGPEEDVPSSFTLEQNYPNPFNPTTTIRFTLAEPTEVSLGVYDASGREVRRLLAGQRAPGTYTVTWDGMDQAGRRVASGTYFYRLDAGGESRTMAMTLLK